jgi:GntR family transcriptional repressor for pyruvate dehydrogenase complex
MSEKNSKGMESQKQTKLFEKIAYEIECLIKEGYLRAGDTLRSERELAKKLGVSRVSLREALRYLQDQGIIFTKPGKGSVVLVNDVSRVKRYFTRAVKLSQIVSLDLMETREILERNNAYLAAKRANKLDIEKMREILDKQYSAFLKSDKVSQEKQDLEFHYAIARATHNLVIVKIFSSIREIMENDMKQRRIATFEEKSNAKLAYEQHEEIFSAIKGGYSEEAALLMFHHVQTFLEILAS